MGVPWERTETSLSKDSSRNSLTPNLAQRQQLEKLLGHTRQGVLDSFWGPEWEGSVTVFVDLDLGTGVDEKRDAGDPSLE